MVKYLSLAPINFMIKNCPFCGSNEVELSAGLDSGATFFQVECFDCYAKSGRASSNQIASNLWNRRNVQTTKHDDNKDGVATKIEAQEAVGMPEEVKFFLEASTKGWEISICVADSVAPHVIAAYQRIADLEKENDKLEKNSLKYFCEQSGLRPDECEENYKLIESQDEKISQLKSQLSTLKEQMKEVIMRGDEMAKAYSHLNLCDTASLKAWRETTAALRQSGLEEAKEEH